MWLRPVSVYDLAQRMFTSGAPQFERLIAASPNSLAALSGRSGVQLAIGLIMPMCRSSGGAATVQLSPCDVHANLLVKIFGRVRVGFSTASGAVVMGEVGCVPLGRWQRTRRVAHASDECAIEQRARIVFPKCNAFVPTQNVSRPFVLLL